ncbi:MAG: hypothetical protein ACREEC_02930, partial [Thermoplasmata archaeon]
RLSALAERGELGVDASLVLATDRFGAGDHASAVELMDRAMAQVEEPEEAAAVAGILASLGEPKRARRLLEATPRLDRSDGKQGPLVTLTMARIDLAEGHPRKSIRRLQGIVGASSQLALSDLMLAAGTAWEAGSSPLTLDFLDAYFRMAEGRPRATVGPISQMALDLCIEAATDDGRWEKARWALSELQKFRPNAPATLRWRVRLALRPGGEPPDPAVEALAQVVGERDARLALVEEFYDRGRESDAMEEVYRALHAPPVSPTEKVAPAPGGIDVARVWLDFLGSGRWGPEEHRARLDEWTRASPGDPLAWAYRAILIEQIGPPEAAQAAWDEAEARVGENPLFQIFLRHRIPEDKRRPLSEEDLKGLAEAIRSLPRPLREHFLPRRLRARPRSRSRPPPKPAVTPEERA